MVAVHCRPVYIRVTQGKYIDELEGHYEGYIGYCTLTLEPGAALSHREGRLRTQGEVECVGRGCDDPVLFKRQAPSWEPLWGSMNLVNRVSGAEIHNIE